MVVSFEDFKKLELKIAEVLKVEDHPNADRLYLVTVDAGGQEKMLVAGIRAHYTKEELVGKYVVVLNNLEPAIIRGIESNGMLLAASDKDKKHLVVLSPDKPIEPGSNVS